MKVDHLKIRRSPFPRDTRGFRTSFSMPGSWWLEASNTDRREEMAMLGDGHQPGNTLLVGIIVCCEYLVIAFLVAEAKTMMMMMMMMMNT